MRLEQRRGGSTLGAGVSPKTETGRVPTPGGTGGNRTSPGHSEHSSLRDACVAQEPWGTTRKAQAPLGLTRAFSQGREAALNRHPRPHLDRPRQRRNPPKPCEF